MNESIGQEVKADVETRLQNLEAQAKTWYEKHVTPIAATLAAATALLAGHIFWH